MSILAERLKELRKETGERQEDLADLLNVQRTTYGEYERDRIIPPIDKLQILAKHFGVSIDYLSGKSNLKINAEEMPADDIGYEIKRIIKYLNQPNRKVLFFRKELSKEQCAIIAKSLENQLETINLFKLS